MIRVKLWPGVLLALCGCSGQYAITGSVTYDGKPVPRGEVVLTPNPEKGNQGPGLLLQIVDGQYQTINERGQVGGAYIARISGYRAPEPGPAMSRYGFPMFIDYVTEVELPRGVAVYDFVVPPQPPVKFGVPIGKPGG